MKIRHLGMATAVVFLAGISFVAVAQQHRPQDRRGPGGEWWNSPQAIEALQLDDQTRGIIQEEVHSTRLELITLKGDVQRAELELQRMLHTEPLPSTSEIEAQVDELVNAQGNVMRQEVLLRARVLALLTPDQRAELESMHRQRRESVRREFRNREPRRPRSPQPTEPPVEPSP